MRRTEVTRWKWWKEMYYFRGRVVDGLVSDVHGRGDRQPASRVDRPLGKLRATMTYADGDLQPPDPYPPGTDAAWAEIHEIERGAGLEPTRIPAPPFNPDYNLIIYRGLSNWAYWLVVGGFVAVIVLAVLLSVVL